MSEETSAIAAPARAASPSRPIHQLPRMATIVVRGLAEDGADSTDAHEPLIKDRRKVVLRGTGKDVGTVHQRESALMSAPPRGLCLGRVERGVCLAGQAFGLDRMCGLKNALENSPLGWDDNCHVHTIVFRKGGGLGYTTASGTDSSAASGTSMMKTQPLPGMLRMRISPPCARTAFRAIESPRPRPDRSLPRRSPNT
jgi:hypothetical protein